MMLVTPRLHLKPTQLERLKEHKYKSQGTSFLEPVLQVFWRWLVTKVPLWLAPNLITFIGLLINVFTTLPIMILDSNARGTAPWWCYITCAVGFFFYQSLDAIDGKQARRTNTNTPLGELFDHGCDAISGFAVLVSALSAVGVQEYPRLGLGFGLLLMVLSYCYHWQTYVSGVLHFKRFDVTEAQFLHMVMLVAAALFGQSIYMFKIPYFDVPFKLVVIVIAYSLSIINGIIALRIIFTSGVGKNGSTVADTSVLSPLLMLLFQVPVVVLYPVYSIAPLQDYCMLFLTAMVFPLVKSSIHIIVASMTKSPLPVLDPIMLGPLLALANVYFGSVIPEKYFIIGVVVYNVIDVTVVCASLCQQICTFLEIQLFTIPYPPVVKRKDPDQK